MDTILKISTSANLAIHAMVYIARSAPNVIHSVGEIAAAQDGSASHLSKVLQRLVKEGLLASRRGPGGGFVLGREAKQIPLLDILEAIDGRVLDCKCILRREKCMFGDCALGVLITHVNRQMHSFLESQSLADMAAPIVQRRGLRAASHGRPPKRHGKRV